MKRLVIVESPTKAKTLSPMLGAGYTVRASMGHVRDLPTEELGVDIEHSFKPTYHILRQKSKTLKGLRAALEDASELYLATDPDREGEAIAWHLLQTLKPKDKMIQRVTFHEITPGAIQAAFAQPRAGVDMDLVNAQQARRVLDRLVGYQVSPLLWKTTGGKSAGRVQSVALRLVVDREREIAAFVPVEYWSIHADLAKVGDHTPHFLARLVQIGNQSV
jgi:DNA topoisomerase-1